jgi:hypothetical protein
MRSEVFWAESDETAKRYLAGGAAAAGAPDVLETEELTALELDLLQGVLTGQSVKEVLQQRGGGVIAYGGDQGPWVEDIRPVLTTALAGLPADQVAAVAKAWGDHEELAEADPADVRALLEELVSLAGTARDRGVELYLWNAMD